jgi:hypothetical protein
MRTKNFLIIQLFSNGDCLYATPIARQLKYNFPDCIITWAISPFCSPIIKNNPYIDEIWEVNYINDKLEQTYKANINNLMKEVELKKFDEVFFSQIIGDNWAKFNGVIRSSIFNNFPYKITVPLQPILNVTDKEKQNTQNFIHQHELNGNCFVILYECAPLSGQLNVDYDKILSLSNSLTTLKSNKKIKIIVSSSRKIQLTNKDVIDGSVLSLRETAYLTHTCDLLIGSSSGITWASTSTSAKLLPSVQLLDKNAYIFNSPIIDGKRNNLPIEKWLELYDFDEQKIIDCIEMILNDGFEKAKTKFGQQPRVSFKLYRGIVHKFLKEFKLKLLTNFIILNFKQYGLNLVMMKYLMLGFFLFPLQVIVNFTNKSKP